MEIILIFFKNLLDKGTNLCYTYEERKRWRIFFDNKVLILRVNLTDFVERIDKNRYPELIRYMKERRLYINEIITVEEEDN